jgi:ATP-binding protein involved in chromosome partitioning
MLGLEGQPQKSEDNKIIPLVRHGVKAISIQFFVPEGQPIVWRGPLIGGAIQQFLRDVDWGELDYLVIDLPPGTGDAALSLSQLIPLTGAVIVTTPQEVSLLDARKAVAMFTKVNVRTLGVIENMSGFICPNCSEEHDIFGSGGGEKIARELELEVLGRIPLEPGVRAGGDAGVPITSSQYPGGDDSRAAQALREVARTVAGKVSVLAAPSLVGAA